jgi:hypothetical protein
MAANLRAQNEFGCWSGMKLNVPVTKDFKMGMEAETRFDRNLSRMKTAFISPYASWDASKYFEIGLSYRLSSSPYNAEVTNRILSHRYALDLEFKNIMDFIKDKSNLGLTLRFRGTKEYEELKRTDNYLRLRIKADYSLPKSKLKPYLSVEMFYHISDQVTYTFSEVNTVNNINKLRASLGFKYAISKKHEIKIFYICQRQILKSENKFILGVGYTYDIDKLKTKK